MKKLHQTLRAIAVPALAMLLPFAAQAVPVTVDVTGAQSWGRPFESDTKNTVLEVNVGANTRISTITFNVNLTAFSPSELGEMRIILSDSLIRAGASIGVNEDSRSGTASYSGTLDLTTELTEDGTGRDFVVGADGILRLEFFESFPNLGTSFDGIWNFGTLIFNAEATTPNDVPEPASLALMALALGAAGASSATRRRRQTRDLA